MMPLNPVKPQAVTLSNGQQTFTWASKSEYDRWVMWNRVIVGGFVVVGGIIGTMFVRRRSR